MNGSIIFTVFKVWYRSLSYYYKISIDLETPEPYKKWWKYMEMME